MYLGLCDNSNNMIIAIRKLISCYRHWLHYLSIIANNYIARYISALGDVYVKFFHTSVVAKKPYLIQTVA